MYHTGFDVHDANIQIQHMDEDGCLGIDTKISKTEFDILDFLDALDGPTTITIETSGSYWWLSQMLKNHPKVSQVNIVDARRSRKVAEELSVQFGYGRASNDRIDAEMSAHLTRMGLAPTIHIPSAKLLEVRTLNRFRHHLVKNRTRINKHANALLKFHGADRSCNSKILQNDLEKIPPYVKFIIGEELEYIRAFDNSIEKTEKFLDKLLPESHPQISLLLGVPGFGIVLARYIVTEIKNIKFFKAPKYLISYSGLAPVEQNSDGKKKGKIKLNQFSNRYLKYAFVQAAHNARNHPKFKRKYEQDLKLHDKSLAKIILARRIIKNVYWMLTRQQPFRA